MIEKQLAHICQRLWGQLQKFPKQQPTKTWNCLKKIKWDKWGHLGSLISGVAATVALFLIHGQFVNQVKAMELENRPYLHVDILPSASEKLEVNTTGEEYMNLYLGAKLVYKNVGKTPACNVKTELHMYNNADKRDDAQRLEQYYVEQFGYFPRPTTVFPGQSGQEIGLFVDAGDGATEYLITIRVSYTGEQARRGYWYSSDMRFHIAKNTVVKQEVVITQDGNKQIQKPLRREYGIWLTDTNTDYDRIGNQAMKPPLPNPYQSRENHTGLRENALGRPSQPIWSPAPFWRRPVHSSLQGPTPTGEGSPEQARIR